MAKNEKVPESVRAVQRTNRKWKASGQQLKAKRGERAETEVGQYYVLDIYRNILFSKYVNLEPLGRTLGALAEWEFLGEAK